MSQFDLGTIDPNTKDGTTLASDLTNWRSAIHSAHRGASAPVYAIAGMLWVDDSADPSWTIKFYDGGDWISLATVNSTNNTVNLAKLDSSQVWNKQQYSSVSSLTDGANIDWDLDTQQVAKVTLAGNRTMNVPTNMQDGAFYSLTVTQDATGSRTLTWNSIFKFPSGIAPTLTTTANAIDKLTFDSDGTNMHLVGISLDLK